MKIAQVSQCYKPVVGGQEVYIKNLNEVLSQNGKNKIRVFQSFRKIQGYKSDLSLVFRFPYLASVFRSPFVHKYQYAFFLFLTKYFSLKKFDVVIVHYAFNGFLLKGLRRKMIILSHGIEWYPDRNTVNNKIHDFIARKTFENSFVVANDTHYFRHLGLDIQPGQRCFEEVAPGKWFIPNCVDSEFFKRGKGLEELEGRKIILVPRQITEDRGIDLAIETFKLFNQQMPGYEMLIVGTPTRGKYFDYCKGLISSYGLEDKVRFVGFVQNKDMVAYYSSSELTLIPTLRREGTSLSALESMACGTLTVSTNVAGLADLPTLQAKPDPADLCEKLVYGINNRARLSAEQEEVTRRVFNYSNWGNAWVKVISRFGKG